jgi:hypothetical protein
MDYVAGLADNWQQDPQWADLERCIEECAAFCILNDISQAFDAGMGSSNISMQGFGQQLSYDRFASRKQELQASYQSFGGTFQDDQGGGIMVMAL